MATQTRNGTKEMTDTPKPPMIVWLQHGSDDTTPYSELSTEDITWSDQCCFSNDYGPYINLHYLKGVLAGKAAHPDDTGYWATAAAAINDIITEIREENL